MSRSLERGFVIAVYVLRAWLIGPVATSSPGEKCFWSLLLEHNLIVGLGAETQNMIVSGIVCTSQASL